MRAVLARGPGAFGVEEVDEPVDDLVIEVEAAGVCAADRMLWTGRHPWGELRWPLIPGHELLGRVLRTDGRLPVGTRVTAEVKIPCGTCASCRRGEDNLCPHGQHLGSGVPGAWAERVGLPARARVHPVPDSLSRRQAVLCEPMACAVHAVARTGVQPGDRVAVAGLGSLGALVPHAARAAGAGAVTAIVRNAAKERLARELGYDAVTRSPDPAAFDAVLDVSGDVAAVAVLLSAVRPGGRVGVYGVYDRPLPLDLNRLAEFGELTMAGAHLAPGCFPAAISLLADVDGDRVVTGVHPLSGIVQALDAPPPRLKEIVCP